MPSSMIDFEVSDASPQFLKDLDPAHLATFREILESIYYDIAEYHEHFFTPLPPGLINRRYGKRLTRVLGPGHWRLLREHLSLLAPVLLLPTKSGGFQFVTLAFAEKHPSVMLPPV